MEFDFSENPGTTFESALPLIFEDVSNIYFMFHILFLQTLLEYVKHLYVNLSGFNL